MNPRTRSQLLEINRAFYAAHAAAFDRSRGARPWPGWERLRPLLDARTGPSAPDTPNASATSNSGRVPLGPVLDIGCGNARFACWLAEAGFEFRYTGVDASPALLEAAGRQLPESVAASSELIQHDFLASGTPGAALPAGPFDLVVLMGVLHHVPGTDWRLQLLEAAADRLTAGGLLVLAAWQFAEDPREQRKRVPLAAIGPVNGEILEASELEPGDWLVRFGDDPAAPPRYCHQVSEGEFDGWPGTLGLARVADFRADGAGGAANRYAVLRRP